MEQRGERERDDRGCVRVKEYEYELKIEIERRTSRATTETKRAEPKARKEETILTHFRAVSGILRSKCGGMSSTVVVYSSQIQ